MGTWLSVKLCSSFTYVYNSCMWSVQMSHVSVLQRLDWFHQFCCENIYHINISCSSSSSDSLLTYIYQVEIIWKVVQSQTMQNLCRPSSIRTGWSRFFISSQYAFTVKSHECHSISDHQQLAYFFNILASNAKHVFMSWYHHTHPALTLAAFNDPIITFLQAVEHIPWEINQSL